MDAETVSALIAQDPSRVDEYAELMANVAHEIHAIEVTEDDVFPEAYGRIQEYIRGDVAYGHPIVELSDLYYFYVVLGADDPSVVENFMGFSYETSKRFFDSFLRCYLGTDDEDKLREVTDKATLLCCTRIIRKIRRSGATSERVRTIIDRYLAKIDELTRTLDTLDF